jgi:hypothetical protein
MANETKSSLTVLAEVIQATGPIPAVRVSSAQARGAAKAYQYWGAVRYEIRLRQHDGVPTAVAMGRARSDRRSVRLATADAAQIAGREGRVMIDGLGALSTAEAVAILAAVARG